MMRILSKIWILLLNYKLCKNLIKNKGIRKENWVQRRKRIYWNKSYYAKEKE